MTANQLAYQANKERERSNLVNESIKRFEADIKREAEDRAKLDSAAKRTTDAINAGANTVKAFGSIFG